ncbi:MAG: lytic transglycosylase domain-containing protein [Eubacteriales bacterium]|nr:lytic transglycosylase domain-containing protein [Eubacteriales bacterium]
MSRNRRKKHSSFFPKLVIGVLLTAIIITTLSISGCLQSTINRFLMRIYPLQYEAEIMEASETYGLEPEFIAAVIYAESEFNPDAQSHAGAKGLMQIMPDTFMWLVDLRDDNLTEEDMLTPSVNIDYGCYYISYLNGIVPGDIYNAAAAYNAGFSHVQEWLQNPDYSADGLVLDTIPFEETHNYINKIKLAEEKYAELYFENDEYKSSNQ